MRHTITESSESESSVGCVITHARGTHTAAIHAPARQHLAVHGAPRTSKLTRNNRNATKCRSRQLMQPAGAPETPSSPRARATSPIPLHSHTVVLHPACVPPVLALHLPDTKTCAALAAAGHAPPPSGHACQSCCCHATCHPCPKRSLSALSTAPQQPCIGCASGFTPITMLAAQRQEKLCEHSGPHACHESLAQDQPWWWRY